MEKNKMLEKYVQKISEKRKKFNKSVRYAGNIVWEGFGNILTSPLSNIRSHPDYSRMSIKEVKGLNEGICERLATSKSISEKIGVGCGAGFITSGIMTLILAGATYFSSGYKPHDNIKDIIDNLQTERNSIIEKFDGYAPKYAKEMIKDIDLELQRTIVEKRSIENSNYYISSKELERMGYLLAGSLAVLSGLLFFGVGLSVGYEFKSYKMRGDLIDKHYELIREKRFGGRL